MVSDLGHTDGLGINGFMITFCMTNWDVKFGLRINFQTMLSYLLRNRQGRSISFLAEH